MATTARERYAFPEAGARMADPHGPHTLFGVARLYLGHVSTWTILCALIPLLLVRAGLGRWRPWDAGIVVLTAALWPFVEWLFHVSYHARPLHVGRMTFDSPLAREHRLHHLDPTIVDHALLKPAVLAVVSAGSIAGFWWALGSRLGLTAAICFHLGGLANGWVHTLTHMPYIPRSRFFRWVRRIHTLHHFKDQGNWFAFTGPFVDVLLGTHPDLEARGLLADGWAARRSSPADALVLKLFSHPLRWFTTVGLQGVLGLFFLFLPGRAMEILRIPDSVHTGAVLQLYGALLLYRVVSEQQVRMRLDPDWCRNYMIATIPFSIGSSVVLGYACIAGLMNHWIGWTWVALSVGQLGEFLYALDKSRREKA